jgi:hypothetical protein
MVFIFDKTKNAFNILILSKYSYRYILFFKFSSIIKNKYSLKLSSKIINTLDGVYLSDCLNRDASENRLISFLKGNLQPLLGFNILYSRYKIAKISKERLPLIRIRFNEHSYRSCEFFSDQTFSNIICLVKIPLDAGVIFNFQNYFLNIPKDYFFIMLLFNII